MKESNNKDKILIIEDEKNIAESMKIILSMDGLQVTVCENGRSGLAQYKDYDLLILDLMLPDIDGFEILKIIREDDPTFPILIVSARSSEDSLITGLKLGADDYLTKPFSIKELVLKIRRALDRQKLFKREFKKHETIDHYSFGGNVIDFRNHVAVTKKGNYSLTDQEMKLLIFMIRNEGMLVSRKDLLREIWSHFVEAETRTIDNFIVRFRKYFEDNPKKPQHIITKRGRGYLFSRRKLPPKSFLSI